MPAMHSSSPQFSYTKPDFRPSTASVCLAKILNHCMIDWRKKPLQNSMTRDGHDDRVAQHHAEDLGRPQARARVAVGGVAQGDVGEAGLVGLVAHQAQVDQPEDASRISAGTMNTQTRPACSRIIPPQSKAK